MSVINKMLRDLDKRGGLGPRSLEEGMKEIERVPVAEEPRPWGRISAIVIVFALAGVVAWYLLQPAPTVSVSKAQPAPATQPAAPQKVAAAPAPAATPPAASAQAPAMQSPPSATTPAASSASPAATPAVPSPAADDRKSAGPSALMELPAMATSAVKAQQDASAKVAASTRDVPASPKLAAAAPATPEPKVQTASVAKLEPATGSLTKSEPSAKAQAPAKSQAPPKAALPIEKETLATNVAPVQTASVKEPPERAVVKPIDNRAAEDSSPVRISVDRSPAPISGSARAVMEYRRANEELARGRTDLALANYAEALKADPHHVPARQAMVVVMLEQGRTADARSALREGIDAVPGNGTWPMLLARMQVESGDVQGGLDTLQRSLATAGSQPDYQAFMATLFQMQSRHSEAIKYYQSALQLAPDAGRLLTGLAISLEAEKRVPEAREAYRKALATNNLGRDLEAYVRDRLNQLR